MAESAVTYSTRSRWLLKAPKQLGAWGIYASNKIGSPSLQVKLLTTVITAIAFYKGVERVMS